MSRSHVKIRRRDAARFERDCIACRGHGDHGGPLRGARRLHRRVRALPGGGGRDPALTPRGKQMKHRHAGRMLALLLLLVAVATVGMGSTAGSSATRATTTGTPLQIYGAWLCGNDACTWATTRNTATGAEFDVANHWLVDRGNGQPSVNLVVLAFADPLK